LFEIWYERMVNVRVRRAICYGTNPPVATLSRPAAGPVCLPVTSSIGEAVCRTPHDDTIRYNCCP
jgi:hypothetical protein